jgi:hypothetical protein
MILTSKQYTKKEQKELNRFNRKLRKVITRPLKNKAEEKFRLLMQSKGLRVTKRGFPDFIVFDENVNILAFVEVKPTPEHQLKPSQMIFQKFCKEKNIPFYLWHPGKDMPL